MQFETSQSPRIFRRSSSQLGFPSPSPYGGPWQDGHKHSQMIAVFPDGPPTPVPLLYGEWLDGCAMFMEHPAVVVLCRRRQPADMFGCCGCQPFDVESVLV